MSKADFEVLTDNTSLRIYDDGINPNLDSLCYVIEVEDRYTTKVTKITLTADELIERIILNV